MFAVDWNGLRFFCEFALCGLRKALKIHIDECPEKPRNPWRKPLRRISQAGFLGNLARILLAKFRQGSWLPPARKNFRDMIPRILPDLVPSILREEMVSRIMRDMVPRILTATVAAIGLFSAIEAAAGTISYSGTSTAPGTSAFVSLSLPKFDTSLGTLDSVTVNVDFARVSGTFSVAATTATAATVNDFPPPTVLVTIRQDTSNSLGFTQIGATGYGFGVSQALPFTVPGNSSQVFNVIQNDVITNNSQNIGSGSFASYASPGGSGTILFEVRNNPFINISGGTFELNAATVSLETVMTVTYAYTPVPVPEPSTWAMAAAGAGLVGLIRWRRRAAASARIG